MPVNSSKIVQILWKWSTYNENFKYLQLFEKLSHKQTKSILSKIGFIWKCYSFSWLQNYWVFLSFTSPKYKLVQIVYPKPHSFCESCTHTQKKIIIAVNTHSSEFKRIKFVLFHNTNNRYIV